MKSLTSGLREAGIGDDWLQAYLEIALQHVEEHGSDEFGFDSSEWHRAKTALDKFLNPVHPVAHPEGTLRHWLLQLMEKPNPKYVFVVTRAGVVVPLITFSWYVFRVCTPPKSSTVRGKLLSGDVVRFGEGGERNVLVHLDTQVHETSSGVSWDDDSGGGTICVYKAEPIG